LVRKRGLQPADVERFYVALTGLVRAVQFRDRDRQTICGITITQCHALDFLVHERLTVLQLGRRLALNKSNASRTVSALESIGAVVRRSDSANHRIRWVEATPSGRRLHDRIVTGIKQGYSAILEPFGARFVRRAATLLDRVSDDVRARSGESGRQTRRRAPA
jgi:DNA-binding MarR family transcriptional regulator